MPSSLACTQLQSECCPNPLGVDTRTPRFAWQLVASQRNATQRAYRVMVASQLEHLAADKGDLWDSGKVDSERQFNINYDGAALDCMTPCWWKVRVWDQSDRPGCWSEPAMFQTGVFHVANWPAQWFFVENGPRIARKEFDHDAGKSIAQATIYVAAQGDKLNSFRLALNGIQVGHDALTPGPTEYFRALYRAYDVTDMLIPGRNVMALTYASKVSCVLAIHHGDGDVQMIVSDDTWRGTEDNGFVFAGGVGMGRGKVERYDARLQPAGWQEPGFNDSHWQTLREPPWGAGPIYLAAQYVGCSVHKKIPPVSIVPAGDGSVIVDFGRNLSGFVRVFLRGPAGTEVRVDYAERLDADGDIDPSTGGSDPIYNVCTLAERSEWYCPTFMYTGFRYIRLTGLAEELLPEHIEACFVHSDVLNDSQFECSDERINKLQQCARRSFLSNLVNIPTDCPARERRGWTADAFAVSEAECLNFDMRRLYRKWFDDISDCQRASGWIPVELPLTTDPSIDINWPAACILVPWDIYRMYGDDQFLAEYYDVMTRYMGFLDAARDAGGRFARVNVAYGDWLADDKASPPFLAAAYHFRCVSLLSRIAAVLGRSEDAERYLHHANTMRQAVNRDFLKQDGDRWFYDTGSQSSNAHALFFDLVDDERRGDITEALVAKFEADGTNTTGFLGTMCLLRALSDNGRDDVAWRLVTNPDPGGWLYMLRHFDATTFLESFTHGESSHNHAFLGGSLSAWCFRRLAGLEPTKPGFKEFRVQPFLPESMQFARGAVHTPYGTVRVSWEKLDGLLRMSVTVPPNTTANVHVPTKNPAGVSEIAQGANAIATIERLPVKGNAVVFRAGSGSYVFEAPS